MPFRKRSSAVNLTAIAGDVDPGADNTYKLGTSAVKWSQVNAVLGTFTGGVTAASLGSSTAASLPVTSSVADGGTAVAVKVGSSVALANAAAKLLSVQNNSVEKTFVDKDGGITVSGVASGSNALSTPLGSRILLGSNGYFSAADITGGNAQITCGATYGIAFQSGASVSFGAATNASVTNGAGQYTGLCRAMPNGSSWPIASTLFHTGTSTANGTTVETTIGTYAHANQFGNDADVAGRGWHVRAYGTFAANGNTKTIKLKFGPTATDVTGGAFTGAFNGGGWYIEAFILRASGGASNQAVCVNYGTTSASPITVMGKVTNTTEATATTDWAILVTGQSGTASSDITLTAMRVDFLP